MLEISGHNVRYNQCHLYIEAVYMFLLSSKWMFFSPNTDLSVFLNKLTYPSDVAHFGFV